MDDAQCEINTGFRDMASSLLPQERYSDRDLARIAREPRRFLCRATPVTCHAALCAESQPCLTLLPALSKTRGLDKPPSCGPADQPSGSVTGYVQGPSSANFYRHRGKALDGHLKDCSVGHSYRRSYADCTRMSPGVNNLRTRNLDGIDGGNTRI